MTKSPNNARQKALINAAWLRLAELELIDWERRTVERRIKAAKFPVLKSLDSFDFKAMPSLHKMLVMELARCD
jgi:DNA replication protein DnaC